MTFEGHEITFILKIKMPTLVFLKEFDILSNLIGYVTHLT